MFDRLFKKSKRNNNKKVKYRALRREISFLRHQKKGKMSEKVGAPLETFHFCQDQMEMKFFCTNSMDLERI